MIDIHTHILPGIDDGARDIHDTLHMARMAADIGVTAIVATPHCNLPGGYDNYFGKEYKSVYRSVVQAIRREGIEIELYPGMEVFGTYDLPELIVEGKIMPLNQSRYILIEFAFDEDPDFASELLRRVTEVGAKPVIAHAERYEFVQDYPQILYQWRRSGYVIQANRGSFMGRFGSHAQKTVYRLMKHHLISVVASDAHGYQRRTPYLLDAYAELCRDYPKKWVDMLFWHNPERICSNKPILKLEPIPFTR